jgi:SAM-dependent methyltransferase
MRQEGKLEADVIALVENHDISPTGHVVNHFTAEISSVAGDTLALLSHDPERNLAQAVREIVKWKTALQCGHSHDVSKGYFTDAEPYMDWQWENIIFPIIKDFRMDTTIDLACGHGRNSEKLKAHATTLHLVDINQSCIDACKERFQSEQRVKFFFHKTEGNSLRSIEDRSVDLVYSWDSMVHFDKLIVKDYVLEIERVLKTGGIAFLHHSNLGSIRPNSDWAKNVGTRSDMSGQLMHEFVEGTSLRVREQHIHGRKQGWGEDELDCVSVLEKH